MNIASRLVINIFVVLLATLVFAACTKEPLINVKDDNSPAVYPDYARLQVGNYWIFQVYENDGKGNYTYFKGLDSTYVEKDTIIGGNTYKKFVEAFDTSRVVSYLRHSQHFLINHMGDKLFSSEDFTSVFSTITVAHNGIHSYTVKSRMGEKDVKTMTPAGMFINSAFVSEYHIEPHIAKGSDTLKVAYVRYSKDVGMVFKTIGVYLDRNVSVEKTLLRYHLRN